MPTKRADNNSSGSASSRSAVKTSGRPVTTSRLPSSPLRVVSAGANSFELPVVHLKVSEGAINAMFWGGLLGAVALGAAEPPVAALIGLAVVIARHRQTS